MIGKKEDLIKVLEYLAQKFEVFKELVAQAQQKEEEYMVFAYNVHHFEYGVLVKSLPGVTLIAEQFSFETRDDILKKLNHPFCTPEEFFEIASTIDIKAMNEIYLHYIKAEDYEETLARVKVAFAAYKNDKKLLE